LRPFYSAPIIKVIILSLILPIEFVPVIAGAVKDGVDIVGEDNVRPDTEVVVPPKDRAVEPRVVVPVALVLALVIYSSSFILLALLVQ
jgi:hypothetical protein